MKGIIFTEFLEMVEQEFGYSVVDRIIRKANDPEDGAYTTVNTYNHQQLVNMIVVLHKETAIPLADLLRTYGRYLFGRLASTYPQLIEGITTSFDLLLNIESVIHTEVRKLYPDSNPPRFEGKQISEDTLELIYYSHRSMGDVAEGLMLGCADYFNEEVIIKKVKQEEEGKCVHFLIQML